MKNYLIQRNPIIIPAEGEKIIKEYFGIPSTNTTSFSLAYMIAPPGWSEPFQCPDFDEITFVLKGQKMIEIENERIILNAGESILVFKKNRVRYSNPFDDPVEYISICIPAFSINSVHRNQI